MNLTAHEYILALPEIVVLAMACVILLVDLFLKDNQRYISYALAQLTLLSALYLSMTTAINGTEIAFHNTFVMDSMAQLLKVFIYIISFAVFFYSREYLEARNLHKGEYYVLGLFAILGMMIMVSAYSFLTMYLGLELLSLSLYAMIAFQRDSSIATESAMKYFVLGALASGMLLYGISIIYGITGTLTIVEAGQQLSAAGLHNIASLFGLSFIIVGLAFKFGAVPFHMWLPDVYQGSPTAVTLFIGTAPKLAAFAMIMRILVEGMGSLHANWQDMLIILVVLSVAIGNVVAIAQTNIKRMLAYSTISHVGFILMGILAGTTEGYASALFYTIVYAIMALGAFGIIIYLSRAGFEADNLDDFKGLNQKSPWFAFMMLIVMFSMAGVPPLAGFHAKLAVLRSIVQVDLLWLAIVGVIFSVIGAFYYLRVVKLMYFDEPADNTAVHKQLGMRTVLSANGLIVLAVGIYPTALMVACAAAFIR